MNRLSDGSPVRSLGSSLVPTPDVAPLSAIVDGIDPSIIPWRSSSSLTPSMYFRSLSAILFRLRVSATGVTLSQNVTRHSGSCSLT